MPRRPRLATLVLGVLVLVLVGLSVPIGILARKPVDPLALLGVLVAALGLLIIAILLGSGAWQMRGTRIAVQSNGQLVGNSGPSGALGFVLLIAFLAVPVFWASFVARQILSWRRATGERRAQLKWLMAGSVATVIGLAGTFLLQSFTGLLGALGAASGGSALQPDQIRRRPDGGRVRGPAERHRGSAIGPR